MISYISSSVMIQPSDDESRVNIPDVSLLLSSLHGSLLGLLPHPRQVVRPPKPTPTKEPQEVGQEPKRVRVTRQPLHEPVMHCQLLGPSPAADAVQTKKRSLWSTYFGMAHDACEPIGDGGLEIVPAKVLFRSKLILILRNSSLGWFFMFIFFHVFVRPPKCGKGVVS